MVNLQDGDDKSAGPQAMRRGRKTTLAQKQSDDENWDQRLGFLMHDVSRFRRIVFDDFMKPLGVTRSQWWILAYLSRHDRMIQSDLANILDLGKAALGGLVDRLETAGLIERHLDKTDRRVKRVHLTVTGNQMVQEMQEKCHQMSERILDGLNEDERFALGNMLAQVKNNLLSIKREASAV